MGILMDLIIIAILVLSIIMGYKKGLINVVFNIFAFFIALIATIILYRPVANIIINNTEIDDKIKSAIINNTTEEKQSEESSSNTGMQKYIEDAIKNTADEAKSQVIETVANTVSIRAVEILTSIILFIVIRAVLIVLKVFTQAIANLPLIKQFNELGGVVYGIAKGLVIVYIILTIMYFVVSINGKGNIAEAINNSYITKILYNNNIIVNYCLLGKNLI